MTTIARAARRPLRRDGIGVSRGERYRSAKRARWWGIAIRMMACAPKSRAGYHFTAAIGLRSLLEDYAPTIPTGPTINTHSPVEAGPWSRTLPQGRREVDPATDRDDPYEDEAYRLWAIKQQSKCPRGPRHFRLRRIRLLLSRLAFAATFLRDCSTILSPDAPAIRLVPAFAAAKTFSLTMRWASR